MRQNGIEVMPLSEVVDNFMASQGNTKRTHYLSTLVHAKWIWKALVRTTVFSIVNKVVEVVNGRVTIPPGVVRLLAISTVDSCNNIRPLAHNPKINTLHLDAPIESSCKCKGHDTLCSMVDSIVYRTEPIEVMGQTYYKRIWNTVDPCGELREVTQTPVYDPIAEAVVYLDSYRTVCPVEVTEDGCLKKTPENERVVREHCGCYMLRDCCQSSGTCLTYDEFGVRGEYNWESGASDIIHLRGADVKRLILTCQLDESCNETEAMVPEFAVDALMFGIMYRQSAFAPHTVMPINAKREAERMYNNERQKLVRFLNPIDMDQFLRLSSIQPKWG